MSLIIDPGARTRALYRWEANDINFRDGNHDIDVDAANYLAKRVWERFPSGRNRPRVAAAPTYPYAQGYSLVYIGRWNRTISTALHELTHARGFGFQHQAHSVGFVKAYIETLAWWFRWDYTELFLSARDYRLI